MFSRCFRYLVSSGERFFESFGLIVRVRAVSEEGRGLGRGKNIATVADR